MRTFLPTPNETTNAAMIDALPTDKPVAIYYRQSTSPQVGNISTAMQQIDLAEDMKRRGWREEDIIPINADEGVSGTLKIDEREGMRRLFGLISDGMIGAVAVVDEDRLFRDVTQIQVNIFIEACREAQVQIITPTITYVFHHPTMGDFYRTQFRFKSEMAAEYLKFLKSRLGRARERLIREGKFAGQRLPMGLIADMREKVDGKENPKYRCLVPYEPYARIVRQIFEIFVETNGSPSNTQRLLTARGIAFPSLSDVPLPDGFVTNWLKKGARGIPRTKRILEIVTNPMYAGHFTWGKNAQILHWNNHEAIVLEDLFFAAFNLASPYSLDGSPNEQYKKVRTISRKKDSVRPANTPLPLLEGKLWITWEGTWRRVGVRYSTQKQGYLYAIDEQSQLPDTKAWLRSATHIDDAISYHLEGRLQSTATLAALTESVKHEVANRETELRSLTTQINSAKRAKEDIVANLTTLTHPSLIRELEDKYEAAEREIVRLTALREKKEKTRVTFTHRREVMARVNEWLQDGIPADARRQLVDVLIERVEIPEFKPHASMMLVVHWADGEQTTIRLKHAAKHIWGYDEQETLAHYMSMGAPQAVLCAALPTRKWSAIQQQIRRNYGKGTAIDGVGTVKAEDTFVEYAYIEHGLQVSHIEEIAYWQESDEWVIPVQDMTRGVVFLSGKGEMLDGKWRRTKSDYRQSR